MARNFDHLAMPAAPCREAYAFSLGAAPSSRAVYLSLEAGCGSVDPEVAIRDVKGGVELDILVTPNARSSVIGGVDPWRKRLVVKVQAVPAEGRANRAVCDLFQSVLGARAEIVHGATDRQKTLFIPLPKEEVLEVLTHNGAGR